MYQVYLVNKIDYFFNMFLFGDFLQEELIFFRQICFLKNLVGNCRGQRRNLKSNSKPAEKWSQRVEI